MESTAHTQNFLRAPRARESLSRSRAFIGAIESVCGRLRLAPAVLRFGKGSYVLRNERFFWRAMDDGRRFQRQRPSQRVSPTPSCRHAGAALGPLAAQPRPHNIQVQDGVPPPTSRAASFAAASAPWQWRHHRSCSCAACRSHAPRCAPLSLCHCRRVAASCCFCACRPALA